MSFCSWGTETKNYTTSLIKHSRSGKELSQLVLVAVFLLGKRLAVEAVWHVDFGRRSEEEVRNEQVGAL
jgi:hypothetical protein